jgi:hypothetical protein
MRNNFFLLPLLSLCLLIGFAGEARAQEEPPPPEVRLRNGTVIKALPSMDFYSDYVDLGDGRKVERSKISLICFSDCKGAPRDSSQKDLVVLKDGRHKSGELIYIVTRADKEYVVLSDERIAFSEISYIKFSDHVFYSIQQAVRAPATANRLVIKIYKPGLKHLSPNLGRLTNLKELEIACQEDLKDLPTGIGNLRKLEKLIIDNGNGCAMSISIPASIGQLKNLKVLVLRGALGKGLPKTIANLQNLEELDLSQNGLETIPSPIASLHKLKKLELDYADIREIPSFIGNLTSLRELSLISNASDANSPIKLPQSLENLKGLKVFMGNNCLKLIDQEEIRKRFPKVVFSFENDIDDSSINEEPPDPKPKP